MTWILLRLLSFEPHFDNYRPGCGWQSFSGISLGFLFEKRQMLWDALKERLRLFPAEDCEGFKKSSDP